MNRTGSKWLVSKDGEPYQNLANAIVYVACQDLRSELAAGMIGVDKSAEVSGLEQFFRSKWFDVLTSLDGEMILQKIEKEFE